MEGYERESLAIRYLTLTGSNDYKIRINAYKKLLDIVQELNWTIFLDETVKKIKEDSSLSSVLASSVTNIKIDQKNMNLKDDTDVGVSKLTPKELTNRPGKIKEYIAIYYDIGDFSQFKTIFSRYIKNMTIPGDEMNKLIYQYFISCLMKKEYNDAVTEIAELKHTQNQYDLTIYLFVAKLISGNFIESSKYVLNISQNVDPEVFNLLKEVDFGFYSTLNLLINFERKYLKEILNDPLSLIYKIKEDYYYFFDLLENYSKCRFDLVCSEIEKMKDKLNNDPFLSCNLHKIIFDIKNNMIKEIIKVTSCVSIKYLSEILRESEDLIENWVMTGIKGGSLKACLDDIDKIIYQRNESEFDTLVTKVSNTTQEIYNNCILKTTGKSRGYLDFLAKNINDSTITSYKAEKNNKDEHFLREFSRFQQNYH